MCDFTIGSFWHILCWFQFQIALCLNWISLKFGKLLLKLLFSENLKKNPVALLLKTKSQGLKMFSEKPFAMNLRIFSHQS